MIDANLSIPNFFIYVTELFVIEVQKNCMINIYDSKVFDLHRPEYLNDYFIRYVIRKLIWNDTLLREWVSSTGFNPIVVYPVFNSLRNSLYVIFGISWSFSDPFKNLNIIGKFVHCIRK